MRIKPPVKALTPATMSVVPRVNSLIGMPNPMAAMPTAAITIPNKDNNMDMFTPRSAILGSGHDAMVTLSVPSGQPLPGSGSVLVFRAFPGYVMLCNSASNGHWEALCGFPVASRETHP